MDRAEYLSHLHAQFGVAPADVVSVVEHATGRSVAASHRLIRGDECEIHRVELTDRAVVYLRVAFPGTPPSKILHEAWAMDRARDRGLPVPPVLATDTIHTSSGNRTAMVIAEAAGNQLVKLLPWLCREDRSTVMNNVGRVLRGLHSISMPGAGVPDDHGVWTDPDTQHRGYVIDRLGDCRHLPAAGLTPAEIDHVISTLESSTCTVGIPVLCHGDVSPQHVFIDSELRMVGLIDWGMWRAGSAASELASLALSHAPTDFTAILAGHDDTDPAVRHSISWHAIAQATHQIAWLTTSGQTAELPRAARALRRALTLQKQARRR